MKKPLDSTFYTRWFYDLSIETKPAPVKPANLPLPADTHVTSSKKITLNIDGERHEVLVEKLSK